MNLFFQNERIIFYQMLQLIDFFLVNRIPDTQRINQGHGSLVVRLNDHKTPCSGCHSTNIFYFRVVDYYYYENIGLSGYPLPFIDYTGFSLPAVHGDSC